MKNNETHKIYQTLDNCGIRYPDDEIELVYRVEHEFKVDENWVYNKMIQDEDVKNSKFHNLIKDKKVKVILGSGFRDSFPILLFDEFECTIHDKEKYSGTRYTEMEIDEWDIWKTMKRVLFRSHFEGDIRELVKEYWYINEPMSEEDFDNGKKMEIELMEN